MKIRTSFVSNSSSSSYALFGICVDSDNTNLIEFIKYSAVASTSGNQSYNNPEILKELFDASNVILSPSSTDEDIEKAYEILDDLQYEWTQLISATFTNMINMTTTAEENDGVVWIGVEYEDMPYEMNRQTFESIITAACKKVFYKSPNEVCFHIFEIYD